MARRRTSRGRGRHRRSVRPSVAIAGYTRPISLTATAAAATVLVTTRVGDVENYQPSDGGETVNRKLIRVGGQAMFAASLAAGKLIMAQFCLWAHPEQESWPAVTDFDPFNDGPGDRGFSGMLAPRSFCRRTFVMSTPAAGGVTETIQSQHMIRSKAERLLRPGWILSAGLYVRGDVGVVSRWDGLLRFVVAG